MEDDTYIFRKASVDSAAQAKRQFTEWLNHFAAEIRSADKVLRMSETGRVRVQFSAVVVVNGSQEFVYREMPFSNCGEHVLRMWLRSTVWRLVDGRRS